MSVSIATKDSFYKKRILLLFGSPHHVGDTFRLSMQFLNQLQDDSYYLQQFNLFEMNIMPCTDCESCKHGLCCFNHMDHYDSLIEAIQRSDLIILASPIYCGGFPAPMKAMMDRTQQFYINDFAGRNSTFPQRKKGILLMTGGNCNETLKNYLSIPTKMFFDSINAEFCGQVIIGNLDETQSFEADFSKILHVI